MQSFCLELAAVVIMFAGVSDIKGFAHSIFEPPLNGGLLRVQMSLSGISSNLKFSRGDI